MVLPRLGLAVMALSLAASAPRAAEPAVGRAQAVSQMRAWTHLPDRSIVAVTPEMAVALLGRGTPGKADHIDGVELQGEVLDDGFAQARGWRSMRLKVDIACQDGGTSVRRMTVFPQHDHGGAGREAVTPIGWVRPKPEAYLGQVVQVVCGAPGGSAPPESSAPARPAPVLRGAIMATADAAPEYRPDRATTAATPRAPARAAPDTASILVQIAATPGEAEARQALSGLVAKRVSGTPGLVFHVDPAMVSGRQVYRAVISGFSDRNAAKIWCAGLRQSGGACFVR